MAYWICSGLQLFPQEYLFKDYDNPILQAWNLSFLPLDLLVSATGLSSVKCHARGLWQWQPLALISLTLTVCSGLQAVAFWALRYDFDPMWWAPNLFLLIYLERSRKTLVSSAKRLCPHVPCVVRSSQNTFSLRRFKRASKCLTVAESSLANDNATSNNLLHEAVPSGRRSPGVPAPPSAAVTRAEKRKENLAEEK